MYSVMSAKILKGQKRGRSELRGHEKSIFFTPSLTLQGWRFEMGTGQEIKHHCNYLIFNSIK